MTVLSGKVDALFFDVDGTLLDSLASKGRAFAACFADVPHSQEKVYEIHLQLAGINRRTKLRTMARRLHGFEPSSTQLDQLLARFQHYLEMELHAVSIVPGARSFLRIWTQRNLAFAVSAMPQSELDKALKHHKLADFFTATRGYPETKSVAVQQLLSDFNVKPKSGALFGDSNEDYRAARSACIPFVQVVLDNAVTANPHAYASIPDFNSLCSLPAEQCNLGLVLEQVREGR